VNRSKKEDSKGSKLITHNVLTLTRGDFRVGKWGGHRVGGLLKLKIQGTQGGKRSPCRGNHMQKLVAKGQELIQPKAQTKVKNRSAAESGTYTHAFKKKYGAVKEQRPWLLPPSGKNT